MNDIKGFEQRGPLANPNQILINAEQAEFFRSIAFRGNTTRIIADPNNPDQKIVQTKSSAVAPHGNNPRMHASMGFYARSTFGETDDTWSTTVMTTRDKRREQHSDELRFFNVYRVVSEVGVVTSALRTVRMVRQVNNKHPKAPVTDPYDILKEERIVFELPIKPQHIDEMMHMVDDISMRQKVIGGKYSL